MKTHSISNPEVVHLLKPRKLVGKPSYELDLSQFFCDTLQRANDFVPSEAGSIFLQDHPAEDEDRPPELVVVACFGEHAAGLVGMRLSIGGGTAGHVLRTGQPYLSAAPSTDRLLADRIGSKSPSPSVISLPLSVEGEVVGVLELLNHRDSDSFSQRELELLEIFAQTLSASIGSAVEAQRSKEMARRDDLTRLYNDRYLHYSLAEVIERSVARGVDCGLIFLDLDRFKHINDNYGHLAGSRVLAEVGDLLRQVLPGPAIPARYGGDEFVVILPETGRQETYWVAETVRKTIEKHVFLERMDPADPVNYPALALTGRLTSSQGMATLQGDLKAQIKGKAVDVVGLKNELLRLADSRMYRAKELGRNHTVGGDRSEAEEDRRVG